MTSFLLPVAAALEVAIKRRTWQSIRKPQCYPSQTAAPVRWPRGDMSDRTGAEAVARRAGGEPDGAGRTPADPLVAVSGEGGGAAADRGGAAGLA